MPLDTKHRLALAVCAGLLCLGAVADLLSQGDAAWEERARGERDGRASPEPVLESIAAFEAVLDAQPDAWTARWKLMRSLHFQGTFASDRPEEQRAIFERGTRLGEDGLDRLAARVGAGRLDELEPEELASRVRDAGLPSADVARLHFWSAIHWGSWSGTVGLLSAVRQGVAGRLLRYTTVTLALEPAYEDGGAYRLLGRLHAGLPRVPFLSGWVDREQALPLIEQGYALAPEHPGNQLLLAVTILEQAPERRTEALALLNRVDTLKPRPAMKIEDLAIREEGRALLAEVRQAGGLNPRPEPTPS